MIMQSNDSPVLRSLTHLCNTILEHPEYARLQERIDAFLDDDEARDEFLRVTDLARDLFERPEPAAVNSAEAQAWESARDALFAKPVVRDFVDARHQLDTLRETVARHVGLTIGLGRLPTPEDLAQAALEGTDDDAPATGGI